MAYLGLGLEWSVQALTEQRASKYRPHCYKHTAFDLCPFEAIEVAQIQLV